MIEITAKLSAEDPRAAQGELILPFDQRQKSRFRAVLKSGEGVAVMLPRGQILRGGDRLTASDGRVILVRAAPEKVLHVECDTPTGRTRAAYHLGNRHVPVQIGDGFLRLLEDHVLEQMLVGLGARVSKIEAPFEPEAGAYGAGHHHHTSSEQGARARIHEYVLQSELGKHLG